VLSLRSVLVSFAAALLVLSVQLPAVGAESGVQEQEYRSVVQDYGKPLGFRGADGKVTGFSVEIMDAVARRAGIRVRHVLVPGYADLVDAFNKGTADITPSNAISPDRAKIFDFTTPYESIPLIIFVRTDSSLQELVPGLRVGAVGASAAVGYLRKIDGIQLELFPGYEDVVSALLERKIDAFTASAERVKGMLKARGIEDKVRSVGHPVGVVQRAIAVKKGDIALRDRLDVAVKELLASPEYGVLHERWFGQYRADAVVRALRGKYGVMVGVNVGPLSSAASNLTEDDRAKNRRVELVAQ